NISSLSSLTGALAATVTAQADGTATDRTTALVNVATGQAIAESTVENNLFRYVKENPEVGKTINSVLSGSSFSSKGCYGVYCVSVGSTPPIGKAGTTKQIFGIGLGSGFSIGGEYSNQITGDKK
ncbi:hypothetical protein FHQ26_12240, partial [Testudinibacter sp. TR-2022]